MFSASYQVAKVWGIPIRLHWSLLIMAYFFVRNYGWENGILLEIGLGLSIILHELGHSLVAIRKGCRVRQIVLMCIGGAAQMERIPERPRDEFLMAIAGPLVSLLLAMTLMPLGSRFPEFTTINGVNLVADIGYINAWLVGFNLIPAFPMDGGRVLRAALTPRFGRLRATGAAARLGQILAWCFGIYGFLHAEFLLVAVAFFVHNAAGAEYRQVVANDRARRGVPPPWPFFQMSGSAANDAEPVAGKVVISPPPYAAGPGEEADIRPDSRRRSWFT